jgi:hypothetical protein
MSEVKVNKISPRSGTTVTLGDSGDTISIPSGVTLSTASFSSTGIDDNATSTAITIDSSENVGIGTSSPIYNLDVHGGTGTIPRIRVQNTGTGANDSSILQIGISGTTSENYIYFADNDDSNIGQIRYDHASDFMSFTTNASEAMRIDSLGRILIGTTSNDPYNSSTETGQVFGFKGSLQLSNDDDGSAGNAALYINQVNTPATNTKSVRFFWEGTEVGVIDTSSTGIGIRLGGTGTANRLDDYEEGTWTPNVGGNATYTVQTGDYIKIGKLVYVTGIVQINTLGTGSNTTIVGLPFSGDSSNPYNGSVGYFNSLASSIVNITPYNQLGNTNISFRTLTSASNSSGTSNTIFQNGTRVDFSLTYTTA